MGGSRRPARLFTQAERDWKAYYASRPEDRKRVDKETRKYIPISDQAIHDHLAGKQTVGVYPLLHDETCWFLAVDFDKKSWQRDADAFRATCHNLGVPAALERSRSGKGAHIWIFFERPISAVTARKLGALLLTRTMERRHQLGLDSYDRLFPNQDTMPKAASAISSRCRSRKALGLSTTLSSSMSSSSLFRTNGPPWPQ